MLNASRLLRTITERRWGASAAHAVTRLASHHNISVSGKQSVQARPLVQNIDDDRGEAVEDSELQQGNATQPEARRKRATDAYAPAVTSSKGRRRTELAQLRNDELLKEMMRYGRHAARADHLGAVLDELLRRVDFVPHSAIRDAIFLAGSCGLYRQGVTLFLSRARRFATEANFALYDSVVDCAYHMKSVDTLVALAETIQPKMLATGRSEVPSELALYRCIWRLMMMAAESQATNRKQSPAATPTTAELRKLRLARVQAEAGGSASVDAAKLGVGPTADVCIAAARRVFNVIVAYDTQLVHRRSIGSTSGNAKPQGLATPDEVFTELTTRARRMSRYGSDHGELAFSLLVYRNYMPQIKRVLSPASLYNALIRVARTSKQADQVYGLFLEYLRSAAVAAVCSDMKDESINVAALEDEMGLHALSLSELLEAAQAKFEEIVLHTCLAALNACTAYELVVSITDVFLSARVNHYYSPSASVLALMLKAVGEVRAAATAHRCVPFLLNSESGSTPSPHEMFVSLQGLARCGLPQFDQVLNACSKNDLMNGGVEERSYMTLQHALNTVDVCERVAAVEDVMAQAKEPLSDRMMILVLQCLHRAESDLLPQYIKKFMAMRDNEVKSTWIELLVLWADRKSYTLDVETRSWILDILSRAGMLDLKSSRVDNFRNQLGHFLHEAVDEARSTFLSQRKISLPPQTRDPRLHFLRDGRKAVQLVSDPLPTHSAANMNDAAVVLHYQQLAGWNEGANLRRPLPQASALTWRAVENMTVAEFSLLIDDNRLNMLAKRRSKLSAAAVAL